MSNSTINQLPAASTSGFTATIYGGTGATATQVGYLAIGT